MKEKSKTTKQSERNTKSIKVAIFCIMAILVFYLGANFLKGVDTFGKKEFYYSVYENSGGLYKGAIVYLHGYPIGKVTKVKLINNQPVQILAEYLLHENIKLPKDSRFDVTSRDMLGGIIVRLDLGNDSQFAKPGDTLVCGLIPQLTDGIEAMKDQIINILASVDTIAVSLKDALTNQTGGNKLAQTLSNIESMTAHLDQIIADNEQNFGKIVTEISAFSKMLTEVSPELKNVVSNFDQIVDSLTKANVAEVIVNTNNTILQVEELVKKANSGNGDVAKLLNEDEIYTKLGQTLKSLDDLVVDIRANPKKYINVTVFGKKEKNNQPKKP